MDNSSYPPLTNIDKTISKLYKGKIQVTWIPLELRLVVEHAHAGFISPRRFPICRAFLLNRSVEAVTNTAISMDRMGQAIILLLAMVPTACQGTGSSGKDAEPLTVKDYTGARVNDWDRAAYKDGQMILRDLLYAPSNGTSSLGDIVKTGP